MASNLRRSKRTIGRRLSYIEAKVNASRRVNVPRRLGPGAVTAPSLSPDVNSTLTAIPLTADGKNSIYRQPTQPSGGTYAEGDLWFDTANGNRFSRWSRPTPSDPLQWVQFTLGDSALGSISANKLTAGTIDASVITVSNINAGNISTGAINAGGVELGFDVGPGTGHYGLSLSSADHNNVFMKRSSDGVTFFRINAGGTNSLEFDSLTNALTIKGTISTTDGTNGVLITSDGYIRGTGGFGVRIQNSDGTHGNTRLFGDEIITGTLSCGTVNTDSIDCDGDIYAVNVISSSDISATMNSNTAANAALQLYRSGATPNSYFAIFRRLSDSVEAGKIQYASGNATVLYTTTSDKRLKTIVGTEKNATDLLNRVKLYNYYWNSDQDQNMFYGPLAQELYEVLPNAVTKGDDLDSFIDPAAAKELSIQPSQPWSVDNSTVVPYLIKAVQELSSKIDALEAEVAKLNNS